MAGEIYYFPESDPLYPANELLLWGHLKYGDLYQTYDCFYKQTSGQLIIVDDQNRRYSVKGLASPLYWLSDHLFVDRFTPDGLPWVNNYSLMLFRIISAKFNDTTGEEEILFFGNDLDLFFEPGLINNSDIPEIKDIPPIELTIELEEDEKFKPVIAYITFLIPHFDADRFIYPDTIDKSYCIIKIGNPEQTINIGALLASKTNPDQFKDTDSKIFLFSAIVSCEDERVKTQIEDNLPSRMLWKNIPEWESIQWEPKKDLINDQTYPLRLVEQFFYKVTPNFVFAVGGNGERFERYFFWREHNDKTLPYGGDTYNGSEYPFSIVDRRYLEFDYKETVEQTLIELPSLLPAKNRFRFALYFANNNFWNDPTAPTEKYLTMINEPPTLDNGGEWFYEFVNQTWTEYRAINPRTQSITKRYDYDTEEASGLVAFAKFVEPLNRGLDPIPPEVTPGFDSPARDYWINVVLPSVKLMHVAQEVFSDTDIIDDPSAALQGGLTVSNPPTVGIWDLYEIRTEFRIFECDGYELYNFYGDENDDREETPREQLIDQLYAPWVAINEDLELEEEFQVVDSIRIKEIHQALQAEKYATYLSTNDGSIKPRAANLGNLIDRIAKVLGINVLADGTSYKPKEPELIAANDLDPETELTTIPAPYRFGHWGNQTTTITQDQLKTGVDQDGNDEFEETDAPLDDELFNGIVYEIVSNKFIEDPNTGERTAILPSGYALVHNYPQYFRQVFDDLDKGLGWQESAAFALRSAEDARQDVIGSENDNFVPKICTYEGAHSLKAEIAYMLSAISRQTSGSYTSSLISVGILYELMGIFGLPVEPKSFQALVGLERENGADIESTIYHPGFSNQAPRIYELWTILMNNIAVLVGNAHDFSDEQKKAIKSLSPEELENFIQEMKQIIDN